MSAHTASPAHNSHAPAHGAHAPHAAGHDDHGHGHSGPDPMKVKMGIILGAVLFIIVLVTVFSVANMPASAATWKKSGEKEPILLPPQVAQQLGNPCDTSVFRVLIIGWNKCR